MNEITFFIICIFWFLSQLILCLKVGNKHIRRMPVYLHIFALLFALEWYFDVFDIHPGWDELGAIIVGIIVCCSGAAVLAGWLMYFIYRYFKRKNNTPVE